MRKFTSVFGFMLVVLLMMTVAFTCLAPRFGWMVDIVLSGSMEPELHTGGLVITRPVMVSSILPGDIITFHAPATETLTTHRVIAIETSPSPGFRTKGDANEEADPAIVPTSSVVGKACFDIPYVGYLTRFVKTPMGLLICLCLPGLAIIAMEVRNIRRVLANTEIF